MTDDRPAIVNHIRDDAHQPALTHAATVPHSIV